MSKTLTMKYFSFLFSLLIFFSCSVSNSSFKDASSWIPTDFNPNKGILLVQVFPTNAKNNKEMEEFLASNYKWRYEVVDKETAYGKTGKYADTQKYPFAFVWGSQSLTMKD